MKHCPIPSPFDHTLSQSCFLALQNTSSPTRTPKSYTHTRTHTVGILIVKTYEQNNKKSHSAVIVTSTTRLGCEIAVRFPFFFLWNSFSRLSLVTHANCTGARTHTHKHTCTTSLCGGGGIETVLANCTPGGCSSSSSSSISSIVSVVN